MLLFLKNSFCYACHIALDSEVFFICDMIYTLSAHNIECETTDHTLSYLGKIPEIVTVPLFTCSSDSECLRKCQESDISLQMHI